MSKREVRGENDKHLGPNDDDAKAMVELVANAGDPIAGVSLTECKRLVFGGIARLIAASSWIWVIGQLNSSDDDGIAVVTGLDGGWQDDRERAEVIAVIRSRSFQSLFEQLIHLSVKQQNRFTRLRSEIIDDKTWYGSQGGKRWLKAGLDHFVMSFCPLEGAAYSTIGLHRRTGDANFSQRERSIVDVLFHNIQWLHRIDGKNTSLDELVALTPRER